MSNPNDSPKPSAKAPTRSTEAHSEEQVILGMTNEYGCLGGSVLMALSSFLGIGVPMMIVLAIFNDDFSSRGRAILAILMWALLSMASFLGQAWFMSEMRRPDEVNVTAKPRVCDEYFALDPRVRDLGPDAIQTLGYLGTSSEPLKRIRRTRGFRKNIAFRDEPRSLEALVEGGLGNVFQGGSALERARAAAETLAIAGLVRLVGNLVALTEEGAAAHRDLYHLLDDEAAKGNPGRKN